MAGNFWQSSHFLEWLLDKQDLIKYRAQDLGVLSEEEYQKVMIFFANVIQAFGEQLKVRQQVIATATVYFKRFYARYSFGDVDPWLLAPTCLFLASKVEEYGVLSNKSLIPTCQSVLKNRYTFMFPQGQEYPYRIVHILECEFILLEVLDCCLVVFHPYRSLTHFIEELGQDYQDTVYQLSWRIINDSLRTDVCLLYPPYLIALAALQMACCIQRNDAKQWFSELNVDMEKILEIGRILLALYDMWKEFDEKTEMPKIMEKLPKPRLQNSS